MKKLYLIRHAKSSWEEPMMSDADRPLNKRGKKDAPLMAKFLSEKNVCPDYMVSSPAKRAWKTAQIMAESLHYPEEKIKIEPAIYEGDMTSLLHLINQMRDTLHDIFFIGHNPAITLLANYLTKTVIDNIATSGIVCIAFNVNSWSRVDKGTGTLVFYEYPKDV
jgi:phosphohistidine phosphatase